MCLCNKPIHVIQFGGNYFIFQHTLILKVFFLFLPQYILQVCPTGYKRKKQCDIFLLTVILHIMLHMLIFFFSVCKHVFGNLKIMSYILNYHQLSGKKALNFTINLVRLQDITSDPICPITFISGKDHASYTLLLSCVSCVFS